MAIQSIQSSSFTNVTELGGSLGISDSSKSKGGLFEGVVKSVESVNQQMNHSAKMAEEFTTEGKHQLHEVIIALEQSDLSFRYMTQVRNKVLDAYSEVMHMQV